MGPRTGATAAAAEVALWPLIIIIIIEADAAGPAAAAEAALWPLIIIIIEAAV